MDAIRPLWQQPLHVPWYAHPNDVIGGWCVMPVDAPPSSASSLPEVADFLTEKMARHVAELHNEWLDTRVHSFVAASNTAQCVVCSEPEDALRHPPANAKTPPASRDGETGGGATTATPTP